MFVTSSSRWPLGIGNAPCRTASSAEASAADMVIEPARMPPALPAGSSQSLVKPTAHASPSSEQSTASAVNLSPSPEKLWMSEGPTRSPTPYMNR
jgi:hypothetical protein